MENNFFQEKPANFLWTVNAEWNNVEMHYVKFDCVSSFLMQRPPKNFLQLIMQNNFIQMAATASLHDRSNF